MNLESTHIIRSLDTIYYTIFSHYVTFYSVHGHWKAFRGLWRAAAPGVTGVSPAAGVRMPGQGEQIPTIIIVFPLSSASAPPSPNTVTAQYTAPAQSLQFETAVARSSNKMEMTFIIAWGEILRSIGMEWKLFRPWHLAKAQASEEQFTLDGT